MVRAMQDNLLRPLAKRLGDTIKPYFLEQRHFDKPEAFPYNINPLAFTDYDEDVIIETARGYGWKKPDDTDANSTNCLLNAFANQVHLDKFGFNPYAYEIAELVRTGCMTKAEGKERLERANPAEQIAEVERELGMK